MNIKRPLPLAGLLLVSLSTIASAHPGLGNANGFMHGFGHPLSGLDHIMVMIGVGLLAARLGGRALWLVPSAFLAMVAMGGAAGMSGLSLPWVETGIALSLVVIGLAVALNLSLSALGAAALVGFFAVFHGHAHGAEMPIDAAGLGYAAGFIVSTALLHASGIALGLGVGEAALPVRLPLLRIGGSAMAVAGAGLLAGVL